MSPASEIDAPALTVRARAGDRAAFTELLRRHYPALLSSCRSMLGEAEGAMTST